MSKKRKQLKTDNSDNWMNESIAEICSSYSRLTTGNIFEKDPPGQRRAVESALRTGRLKSSSGRDRAIGRRGAEHRGELELTRGIASAAPSCDRNEHASMARNVLLPQENEICPAAMKTTEAEE